MGTKFPTFKRLWRGWKRIAAKIAHFQGNLLLGLIYFIVVTPLACLFRLFRQDPLAVSPKKQNSYWVRRIPITSVADFLKREF
jgi:hypothetical protein